MANVVEMIRNRPKNRLVEGTPDEIAAYRSEIGQAALVKAVRMRRDWLEIDIRTITVHGDKYVGSADGTLYELLPVGLTVARWDSHSVSFLNEHSVAAYIVKNDGTIEFLGPSTFKTVKAFEHHQEERAAKKAAQAEAKRRQEQTDRDARDRFLASQPLQVATLADVEGRPLPTVRAAAALLLGSRCELDVDRERLVVRWPALLSGAPETEKIERAALAGAVRVLLAAGDIVTGALSSRSAKDLLERLPDAQVAAGGGIVS